MTIYKEYKIDNYRQAIDKIKEGILFSEITMPKDEFYKLYDYAEDSYFGEKNAFNLYLYAMSIFFTSTDETKYDFAKQIGGDKVDVSLLLTPGTETHTYEPTPQDIINVNKADLYIYTGKYMEN